MHYLPLAQGKNIGCYKRENDFLTIKFKFRYTVMIIPLIYDDILDTTRLTQSARRRDRLVLNFPLKYIDSKHPERPSVHFRSSPDSAISLCSLPSESRRWAFAKILEHLPVLTPWIDHSVSEIFLLVHKHTIFNIFPNFPKIFKLSKNY